MTVALPGLRYCLPWLCLLLAAGGCAEEPAPGSRESHTAAERVAAPAPDGRTSEAATEDDGALPQALVSGIALGGYREDLAKLRERGVIRALVSYSQTDFFLDDGYIRGLQADALRAYEQWLNRGIKQAERRVSVKFVPVPFNRLIPALNEGRGDIAAAMLTATPERRKQVLLVTGSNLKADEVVVRHQGADPIPSLDRLQGKTVHVLKGSSYAEHLLAYNRKLPAGQEPVRVLEANPYLHSEDLLELVNAGVIEYTVVDSYMAELWSRVLERLVIETQATLSRGNSLGWAVRRDNPQLFSSLQAFFQHNARQGNLLPNMLNKRYLESVRWLRNPLMQQERDKLNHLLPIFVEVGNQHDIDPLALAAQAYQESRFDQNLKSHRGAVGIMQLLPATAGDLGVEPARLRELEGNIDAGARYLAYLRERYFSKAVIAPADRLFFSWAAYNAGPGNVRKMRRRAEQMGLDPNRWFGHVEVAAARIVGAETVNYVDRIYKYYTAYTLSSRLLAKKNELLESLQVEALACRTQICQPQVTPVAGSQTSQ